MKIFLTCGALTLIFGIALTTLGGYGATVRAANDDSSDRGQDAQQELVDCVLPGQVKKMGGDMSYMTPKRQVKATAKECEKRGGKVSTGSTQAPSGK